MPKVQFAISSVFIIAVTSSCAYGGNPSPVGPQSPVTPPLQEQMWFNETDFAKKLVRACYVLHLNREPSQKELRDQMSNMPALKPAGLCDAILDSEEAQQKVPSDVYVRSMYKDYLHREPSSEEAQLWANALATGLSRSAMRNSFIDSTEFAYAIANHNYLIRTYNLVLGREPDKSGFFHAMAALAAGLKRSVIHSSLMNSDEFVSAFKNMGREAATLSIHFTQLYRSAAIISDCPNANPNDQIDDHDALQACFDRGGIIRLVNGSPGYITNQTIGINRDHTLIVGLNRDQRARVIAGSRLNAPAIVGNDRTGIHLTFIEVNGMSETRAAIGPQCDQSHRYGETTNFMNVKRSSFNDNRFANALCGSAFVISGEDYEVARNRIDDNGVGTEASQDRRAWNDTWADGITIHKCLRGRIHHNHVINATDVGIVNGGGTNCAITDNVIENTTRHAFAGIALHSFPAGAGEHSGSQVQHNRIISSLDMNSLGLSIGVHSWFPAITISGGSVTDNVVTGARINLLIDGAIGTVLRNNVLTNAHGRLGCDQGGAVLCAYNHAKDITIPDGCIKRDYDGCIP